MSGAVVAGRTRAALEEESLSELSIRLLGGLDVRCGDEPVTGFESQKVRALFAYLALHRHKQLSRDRLASLLWPDRGEESARRNLRQALYNIRVSLAQVLDGAEVLLADHQTIRLHPDLELWLDVEAFEDALRSGLSDRGSDPHQLAIAARLYAGDLLSGFLVKGGSSFEEWLVSEQERLREGAIAALRTLVEAYLARGEYRVGIQFALRLVAVDPLSEEAHRCLIQLYALSGRRNRALTQYEELRDLLASELGVEPMAETAELYETILHGELPSRIDGDEQPLAPVIPLVGRERPLSALESTWRRVAAGSGRITLVFGPSGSGKSRVVGSIVDAVTSRERARVVRGRCYESAPLVGFQVVTEALHEVLAGDAERVEAILGRLDPALKPATLGLLTGSVDRMPTRRPTRRQVFEAIRTLLAGLGKADPGRPQEPLIVILDDLQWADPSSLALLNQLAEEPIESAVWILGTCRDGGPEPLRTLLESASRRPWIERLELPALAGDDLREMALALIGKDEAAGLAGFLERHEGTSPLAAVELINHLWDRGILRPGLAGSWRLTRPVTELRAPGDGSPATVAVQRILDLPNSVRRLATLAAVAGPRFDAELLTRAGEEHRGVVAMGLEMMLERWLVRQSLISWSQPGRQRDLDLWASGVREGSFEFSHHDLRAAALSRLAPVRRRVLHRSIGDSLIASAEGRLDSLCEVIIHHWIGAGEQDRLLPVLIRGAERACSLYADEVARIFVQRARRLLDGRRETGAAVAELEVWSSALDGLSI